MFSLVTITVMVEVSARVRVRSVRSEDCPRWGKCPTFMVPVELAAVNCGSFWRCRDVMCTPGHPGVHVTLCTSVWGRGRRRAAPAKSQAERKTERRFILTLL